jgi:hypothetical protein
MKKNMNSNKNLRSFLQGMQFYFKAKGIKVLLFAPSSENKIIKNSMLQPNLTVDIDGFVIFLRLFNNIMTS